jgi:hypothetical protein
MISGQELAGILEFRDLSTWYLVKLELGRTEELPNGSAARALLLRLPLARDGSVDEAARAAAPRGAFVRRFWENEPDRSGTVLRTSAGWNLVFPGESTGAHHHLGEAPIRPGAVLEVKDPEGKTLPFRVVSLRPG